MEPEERASVAVPLEEWLDRLAQRGGAPGGGSASGVLLGVGSALISMVLSYGDRSPALSARAAQLRADALADALADATASAALGSALAEPTDAEGRDAHVRDAAIAGARSSARLGATGAALVDLLEDTADDVPPGLDADLGVAAEAITAGLGGALINLRGDVALIERRDGTVPADIREAAVRMETDRRRAATRATAVREG